MKKRLLGIVAVSLILGLSGCGDDKNVSEGNETVSNEVSDNETESDNNQVTEIAEYDVEKLVDLGEYKGVEVNTYISDEDVEKAVETELDSNPLYEEITDGKVKDGDTVNIDFVGKKDGVEFENGSMQGFDLVIGSGSFIDGFEDGLIDTKPGDVVDLNLKFPDDYQNSPELAGKDVVFTVTVNYIKGEEIEQKFDDKFVERITDGEYKTTDDYRKKIKDDLYQQKVSSMVDNAFIQIVDNSTVSEVPQDYLSVMKDRINASYVMMAEQYGYDDLEGYLKEFFNISKEDYDKKLDETATAYVEQQLIAEAIAKKENITITDEEYQEYLNSYLESNGDMSLEEMEKYTLETYKSDLKSLINETILLEKVMEVIGSNIVEINDKPEE